MSHLIDKDALVAEIRNKIDSYKGDGIISIGVLKQHCEDFIDSLDAFETKEVDLDEEINKWQGCEAFPEGVGITPLPKAMEIVEKTAKHFFELGLKVRKEEVK